MRNIWKVAQHCFIFLKSIFSLAFNVSEEFGGAIKCIKRGIFLLICITLISTSSYSQIITTHPTLKSLKSQQCNDFPDELFSSVTLFENLNYQGSMPTCDVVEKYAEVVEKIQEFTSVRGPFALELFNIDTNSYYSSDGVLYMPQNFFSLDRISGAGKINGLKESLPMFAHEYGHFIFLKRLEDDFTPFKKYLLHIKQVTELDSQKQSIESDLNKLVEKIKSVSKQEGEAAAMKLVPLLIEKSDNLKKVKGEIEKLVAEFSSERKKIDSIVDSYIELFADTISLLTFEDPSTISNVLKIEGDSEYHAKKVRYRDFSKSHPIENWSETEVHAQLAPVRTYIWSIAKNEITSQSFKANFIELIYQTMLLLIRAEYEFDNLPGPKERNAKLIFELEKHL